MSARKGRGAKVPKVTPKEKQKVVDNADSPNLSAIGYPTSFSEGLQANNNNPLHSTALEEDLKESEEGQTNKDGPQRKDKVPKENVKRRTAGKRKEVETDGESEKEEKNKRRNTGGKAKEKVKNQQKKKDKETEKEPESDQQSQEESDVGVAQKRRAILSSDEEVDEETSWKPSPKKRKMHSLTRKSSSDKSKSKSKSRKSSSSIASAGRKSLSDKSKSRKSSSGSASSGSGNVDKDKQKTKKAGGQGGTQLDVVLDAFTDFCEQYSESVESKAVKRSIDCFASHVKEQLLEQITSQKELKVLKRENAKVGSLIRTKTQRLVDAKYELMRAERKAYLLQKEKDELTLRLSDLKLSQAFLHGVTDMNTQYLEHRRTHPKEKETYGAASLPALLLEAKHVQTTETQLRGINNQLKKRLDN